MKKIILFYIICIVFGTACSKKITSNSTSATTNLNGTKRSQTQTGNASYYADKFNGRPTASGESYNSNKFTAAHRKLPFGTEVKVTNLANGKTVIVRVNDRGPFVNSRIIDLSKAAAKQIDMINAGIAKVKIEYKN